MPTDLCAHLDIHFSLHCSYCVVNEDGFFFKYKFYFPFNMYGGVACLHDCVAVEARRERTVPENGVTDSGEPPCECREMNPGPLEEHPVLLITEPSLQLQLRWG